MSAELAYISSLMPAFRRVEPRAPREVLALIDREAFAPTFMLGCDPARFGVDANTLFIRHADWIIAATRWHGLDTVQNAQFIAAVVREWEAYGWICLWACIDVIGVGGGTVDNLWHRGERFKQLVKPVNVAMRASDAKRYKNVRAELAWNLRRRFRDGRIHFLTKDRFPDVPWALDLQLREKLERQCTTIQYASDESQSGMIKLESKKQYKDRMEGSESPDDFDGLTMVFNDGHAGLERRPASIGAGVGLMAR